MAHSLTPTDPGGRVVTYAHSAQDDQNSGTNPERGHLGAVEETERSHGKSSTEEMKEGKPPQGFGRILRDASGAVIDVVLGEEEEEMRGGEEVAKDKGLGGFEIDSPSGQPGRIAIPAGSGWLLEDREKGGAEKERAEEVLEGALSSNTNNAIKEVKLPLLVPEMAGGVYCIHSQLLITRCTDCSFSP